jgi:hypothetical protein
MYSVIRKYSGENAGKLFDELEANAKEVESIIGEVPGLVSYALIRTSDGGMSVAPPDVSDGTVIIHRNG